MASAWANSWGSSWGDSWGVIADDVIYSARTERLIFSRENTISIFAYLDRSLTFNPNINYIAMVSMDNKVIFAKDDRKMVVEYTDRVITVSSDQRGSTL